LKLNLPGLMVHLVSFSICAITPLIALFHVPFLVAKGPFPVSGNHLDLA